MAQFSGQRVRGFRDGAGLSRQALAARIGCSTEAVAAWETGRSTPLLYSVTALAEALAVTPGDLEQVHDDPVEEYVTAAMRDAEPLPPETLRAVARVLARIRARRLSKAEPAA